MLFMLAAVLAHGRKYHLRHEKRSSSSHWFRHPNTLRQPEEENQYKEKQTVNLGLPSLLPMSLPRDQCPVLVTALDYVSKN